MNRIALKTHQLYAVPTEINTRKLIPIQKYIDA